MKRFEMIREMFNSCENGRMRDVDIREIETDDIESVVSQYTQGKDVKCEKLSTSRGVVIYDIETDGMSQRLTFTEI